MNENTNHQTNRWISDFLAGLTVSFAALALGAAFGVMSGRGAFAGMIGAAVIPIIASTFGGTRIQASGAFYHRFVKCYTRVLRGFRNVVYVRT